MKNGCPPLHSFPILLLTSVYSRQLFKESKSCCHEFHLAVHRAKTQQLDIVKASHNGKPYRPRSAAYYYTVEIRNTSEGCFSLVGKAIFVD